MSIIYTGGAEMPNKEDLRVVKTRRGIEGAFMELLKEHSFEQITVRQLLEHALISKGTFYAHYLDKYDLAEKIAFATLQEFRLGIQERMAATIEGSNREAIMSSLLRTLTTTIPRLNLLKKVRTENLDVEKEMRAIIAGEYLDFQKRRGTKLKHSDLRAHIITTFILGFLEWQRLHPFENSLDEYVKEISLTVTEYDEWIKKLL